MNDNQNHINFTRFKQLFQQQPYSVTLMMYNQASPSLKKTNTFKQCLSQVQKRTVGTIPKILLTPSVIIFVSTIILHRKRSFALTSGTVLRRFTLKYIPAIILYGTYQYFARPQLKLPHLEKDYAQIQEELQVIFQRHSQKYINKGNLLDSFAK